MQRLKKEIKKVKGNKSLSFFLLGLCIVIGSSIPLTKPSFEEDSKGLKKALTNKEASLEVIEYELNNLLMLNKHKKEEDLPELFKFLYKDVTHKEINLDSFKKEMYLDYLSLIKNIGGEYKTSMFNLYIFIFFIGLVNIVYGTYLSLKEME